MSNQSDDEVQLGAAGSAFTIAEKRALAKHIASVPDWLNGRREWDSFFVAVSPCDSPELNWITQRTPL